MSHRIASSLVGGLLVALFVGLLAIASPAHASSGSNPHWRPGTTVCVDLPSAYPTRRWNVRGEIDRWNTLAGGPRYVARERCAYYNNSIRVRVRYSNAGYQAITYPDYSWDTGVMKHADVFLNPQGVTDWQRRNPYFKRAGMGCLRAWAMGHELGHTLGLDHYPNGYEGNIMAYQSWWIRCGLTGPNDRSRFYHIY